jgi:hypothetical protein
MNVAARERAWAGPACADRCGGRSAAQTTAGFRQGHGRLREKSAPWRPCARAGWRGGSVRRARCGKASSLRRFMSGQAKFPGNAALELRVRACIAELSLRSFFRHITSSLGNCGLRPDLGGPEGPSRLSPAPSPWGGSVSPFSAPSSRRARHARGLQVDEREPALDDGPLRPAAGGGVEAVLAPGRAKPLEVRADNSRLELRAAPGAPGGTRTFPIGSIRHCSLMGM